MKSPDARERSAENLIKAQGYALGFDLVGIASVGPMDTAWAFDSWIESGYAGEMKYLLRGAAKRADSRLPLAGATSAIVVGLSYGGREPAGPIARYARGDDYHDIMTAKLEQLHRQIKADSGRPINGKAYVDTGPILERDLDSMIQDWMELVEHDEELTCIPLSFEGRTGHLPNLIADLVNRLRLPPTNSALVSLAAREHGELRRKQGYTPAMVVEESRILQVSIFNTLQKNLSKVDFSKVLLDVITIADEVDSQLKQAMFSYIEPRPQAAWSVA
jgi:hypothetical protein